MDEKTIYFRYIVCVYSSRPSHQFFGRVGTFPGLNQHLAEDEVSCSRKQCSASSEAQTSNPTISSQALYHCATALHSYMGANPRKEKKDLETVLQTCAQCMLIFMIKPLNQILKKVLITGDWIVHEVAYWPLTHSDTPSWLVTAV